MVGFERERQLAALFSIFKKASLRNSRPSLNSAWPSLKKFHS